MDDAEDGIVLFSPPLRPRLRTAQISRLLVATFMRQRHASFRKEPMSVAFRRESDDEHKEPEYELPIPVGANLVTPRGLRLLGEEVARIEAAVAIERDEDARKKLQRQLRYLGTRKATAEVQAPADEDVVGIGSRVRYMLGGAERSITLVGHDEADPAAGRIAFTAPLGRALMGAEAGDMIEFQGREDAIEILSATADPEVMA
jgi:transcription elongation GreA/GreB family factor